MKVTQYFYFQQKNIQKGWYNALIHNLNDNILCMFVRWYEI